jgi:hypothetical protein
VRSNKNTDTPLPPDEPAAPNPPDGVQITYLLGPDAHGPVTLEIIETTTDTLLRRYSSDDPIEVPVPGRNIPDYWIRPPQRLSSAPGLHRFIWDVRLTPPAVESFDYPMAATPHNTPKEPRGIWVMPGTYQVRLTVGGRALRQAVLVKMDPRVKTSAADLALQFRLSKAVDDAIRQLSEARKRSPTPALNQAYGSLPALLERLQEADARPTAATEAAVNAALERANAALH